MADGLNILIVDDNFAAAQTTGWLVEALGHRFTLADGAPAAFEAALRATPDVVLMDIGLPGMNGLTLCSEMKAMTPLSQTVFIAQTGYGDQRHRDLAASAGCEYFLLKPFELAQLDTLLSAVARRKQARAAEDALSAPK